MLTDDENRCINFRLSVIVCMETTADSTDAESPSAVA